MINEQREAGGEKHRDLSHATPSLSREPPARTTKAGRGRLRPDPDAAGREDTAAPHTPPAERGR